MSIDPTRSVEARKKLSSLSGPAGMLLVAVTALGLVELTLTRLLPPQPIKVSGGVELADPHARELRDLWAAHQRFDENGVPLWYVPRSWAQTTENLAATLQSVAENQRRQTEVLDRIIRKLEKE